MAKNEIMARSAQHRRIVGDVYGSAMICPPSFRWWLRKLTDLRSDPAPLGRDVARLLGAMLYNGNAEQGPP
jgi:hypothetical protein